MTRYTRAKGSKASNERLPNEATPWHEMKQDLMQNSVNHKENKQNTSKVKTAKELLKERDEVLNGKSNWAEFEENKVKKISKHHSKVTNKSKEKSEEPKTNSKENKISKKKKHETVAPEVSSELQITKKLKILKQNIPEKTENADAKPQILSKRQKRNIKHKVNKESNKNSNTNNENLKQEFNVTGNDWDNSIKFGKYNGINKTNNDHYVDKNVDKNIKKILNDDNLAKGSKSFVHNPPKFDKPKPFENQKIKKRKLPKIRDDKEHKRRKPDVSPKKMIINGVEVEIVPFDGFPVQKHDAERLKELKKEMIMKGIPKSEVDAAIKLERRKAEKALTRIKKNVCFHCRKSGHNLSDCPELANEQSGTGICFKCGSTEHTHFECKVNKTSEYRYATCFICREQGHIAKQCPDNPKGVYPQGGACKVCSDVTHLKKDCPELAKQKEQTTLTVDKITDNMESLNSNDVGKDKNKESNLKNKESNAATTPRKLLSSK